MFAQGTTILNKRLNIKTIISNKQKIKDIGETIDDELLKAKLT